MKLFRKKGVTQPVEKTKSKTPYQEGEAFIRAAKEFEKSESESIKKREKAAWIGYWQNKCRYYIGPSNPFQ